MPSWWGKSSAKEVSKKANKESFLNTIHRKFRFASEDQWHSRRHAGSFSGRESRTRVPSRSTSPSNQVSRCQSFVERPNAQPLPLPGCIDSGISAPATPRQYKTSERLQHLPLPKPNHVPCRIGAADVDGDLTAGSVSSDSDDPPDSRILSPLASDCETGNRTAISSPSRTMLKDQVPTVKRFIGEALRPADNAPSRRGPSNAPMLNLHIPHCNAFGNALDSSMSSPSKSPIRGIGPEQVANNCFRVGRPCSDAGLFGSTHCSSPNSGQNSGHNSVDMSAQLFWQNRCSTECSPIPSPRMRSPGPSSRIHSGSVTPMHPGAGGAAVEYSNGRTDDVKQLSHRLPLPPLTILNSCPFSPPYSAGTTPSVPRSPGSVENPISPGSQWKKGRLLGRGTFGHVYLGFNSESGEMCAMKEVTLFLDDAKSKESAQQLGQEIVLLSRLRHPNIVQYYGSGMVDDKLYIYLEYVSGGSIYKLLQEYGQFGEIAIRSYTHQILSGLAYLHAKNTIHRDIKGANILVDPNGRVKLADFGMAKHISGQSCPLSFKGSPYWMAPEVIKNVSGCNLAVDIWSLGCTVLEMATTKPPWSQYEGVAAMFKIGNSKELPTIPHHLSDDGKDFVKQCLQRNPLDRPTAAQLLEHPFVKNAAPLDRSVLSYGPSEPLQTVTNAVRSLGIGQAKDNFCAELGVSNHSTPPQSVPGTSGILTPRNISSPVSPIGSPLMHSRSPQLMSGRTSPSPISSPCSASGSSTPLTGVSGAVPFHHWVQPTHLIDGRGMSLRSRNGLHGNFKTSCEERKPEMFPGIPQITHAFMDIISENGIPGNQFRRPVHLERLEVYDRQSVLAARVSQQLLRDHVKLNPSLDLSPRSPLLTHNNGI